MKSCWVIIKSRRTKWRTKKCSLAILLELGIFGVLCSYRGNNIPKRLLKHSPNYENICTRPVITIFSARLLQWLMFFFQSGKTTDCSGRQNFLGYPLIWEPGLQAKNEKTTYLRYLKNLRPLALRCVYLPTFHIPEKVLRGICQRCLKYGRTFSHSKCRTKESPIIFSLFFLPKRYHIFCSKTTVFFKNTGHLFLAYGAPT